MLKKYLFIAFIFSLSFAGCGIKAVLYGEHELNSNQDYYRIFLDQFGDYYPDISIPNSHFKLNGSHIDLLYTNHPQLFYPQFATLGLDTTKGVSIYNFQEELIKYYGREINGRMMKANCTSVTFILVGYNNKYQEASEKLKLLREKVAALLNAHSKNTFVVELYWDGKTNLFKVDAVSIFDNAQANSYNAGIQLRLLLNQIKDAKDFYFISHSLGANVVTECLFNQIKKVQNDSAELDSSLWNSLVTKYLNPNYILDKSKRYHAAIVAPAIPGQSTFCDYGKRGYEFNKYEDNYRIIGGINTHDIILNKIIHRTSLLGSTSFGCKYWDVKGSFDLFEREYVRDRLDTVDFSVNRDCHHGLDHYMKTNEYDRILTKLYRIK